MSPKPTGTYCGTCFECGQGRPYFCERPTTDQTGEHMRNYEGRTVVISFTRTTEYQGELDWADAAKALGVTQARLAELTENGGADYEPSDAALKRLRRELDETSDETTIDDLYEV